MGKKYSFDVHLDFSKNITGGFITTLKPMTLIQAENKVASFGKEFLKNNKKINKVSYSLFESDETKDSLELAYTWVIVRREGRKIVVLKDSQFRK